MTPPPRPASNNPFLDDISSSAGDSLSSDSPQFPPEYTNNASNHPTAQEEKSRLRQKYMEQRNVSDGTGNDLPPSYEEVAGSKAKNAPYPREKSSRDGVGRHNSDSRYNSRSGSHRESGEKSLSHRRREGSDRHNQSSRQRDASDRHRRRSGRDKSHSSSGKKVIPKNVDTIDKLDVTGLFGGAFHHDGPFDACTPHRNRDTKAAPVLAFPADGPNSSISGATASKSAMNEVFGRDDIDDDDGYLYGKSRFSRANNSSNTVDAIKPNLDGITQFDTNAKTELVHGPTTVGLGSTTFLDGAPAGSAAIREDAAHNAHGIQRKKSLSQRLRNGAGNGNAEGRTNGESYRREPLKLAKTHSGHLEYDDPEQHEDVYLGVRVDPMAKKESTGNKLLRRVKSLKVSRKS